MLSASEEMVWMQGTDGSDIPTPGLQFLRARVAINTLIQTMAQTGVAYEYVYDPINYTSNVVLPKTLYEAVGIKEMFADAGYKEQPVPQAAIDAQQSREFREALLAGSQINKKWH